MFLLLYPSMPDHHLTTTVQWCSKISEKPIVTTNNGLFLVLEPLCKTNIIYVTTPVYTALS